MCYSASHPSPSFHPPLFSLSIISLAVLQITLLLDVLFLHGYLVYSLCFSVFYCTAWCAGAVQAQPLSVFHTTLLFFQYSLKSSKLILPFLLFSYSIYFFLKKQMNENSTGEIFISVFQLFMTDFCSKHPSNWLLFIICGTVDMHNIPKTIFISRHHKPCLS